MFPLPIEMVEEILKYLDISDIRKLNKMIEFIDFMWLFQKNINKNLNDCVNYYNEIYRIQVKNNITKDLERFELGYDLDRGRWSVKIINEVLDSIQFCKYLLKRLEKENFRINKFIEIYNGIIEILNMKYNRLSFPLNSVFKIIPDINEIQLYWDIDI